MGIIIIIIIGLLLLLLLFKKGKKDKINKNLNTIALMGAPGMGKTYIGVKLALKRLEINREKTRKYNKYLFIRNLFRKLKKQPKLEKKPLPQLYANFRIEYKNIISIPLTADILNLKEKIIENSVVVADEFGTIASQFAYQDQDLTTNISELTRLFRHYVGEKSLLVVIDQDTDRISLEVRRSLGAIYEIIDKKILWKYYNFKLVKYINFKQTNENVVVQDRVFSIKGFFKKPTYDSRYYSERYQILKNSDTKVSEDQKELELLRLDNQSSNLDILINKKANKIAKEKIAKERSKGN